MVIRIIAHSFRRVTKQAQDQSAESSTAFPKAIIGNDLQCALSRTLFWDGESAEERCAEGSADAE
jgi:hypothetical protein